MNRTSLERQVTSKKQRLTHEATKNLVRATRHREARAVITELEALCRHHPQESDRLLLWKIAVLWAYNTEPREARQLFESVPRTERRRRYWEPIEIWILDAEERRRYGKRFHPANASAHERQPHFRRSVPEQVEGVPLTSVQAGRVTEKGEGGVQVEGLDLIAEEIFLYTFTPEEWLLYGWPLDEAFDPDERTQFCEIGLYQRNEVDAPEGILVHPVGNPPLPDVWCHHEVQAAVDRERERFLTQLEAHLLANRFDTPPL